ncbi:MAG: YggS family pyridoxal phosphate-dependent enzyme [Sphingobacteriales bacterium]|nr:MAG: YggS family pyridoxal phosphate-dependent enzyme [Sphingobacteriales bacterium]
MKVNKEKYNEILASLKNKEVLVAVSKIQPIALIQQLYDLGQRDFGENYVQELLAKEAVLPKDIRWHFIGHLQSNKVKYIAPFVHLIHGVDSEKLLTEINKQALKNERRIHCLLQVHIAQEETKFGFDEMELKDLITQIKSNYTNYAGVDVCGLMGMASFSDDENKVRTEFKKLRTIFDEINETLKNVHDDGDHPLPPPSTSNLQPLNLLSMGMSGDYKIALEEGSNMLRIGSLLFGARLYNNQ